MRRSSPSTPAILSPLRRFLQNEAIGFGNFVRKHAPGESCPADLQEAMRQSLQLCRMTLLTSVIFSLGTIYAMTRSFLVCALDFLFIAWYISHAV
jgi:hypothetical protein